MSEFQILPVFSAIITKLLVMSLEPASSGGHWYYTEVSVYSEYFCQKKRKIMCGWGG